MEFGEIKYVCSRSVRHGGKIKVGVDGDSITYWYRVNGVVTSPAVEDQTVGLRWRKKAKSGDDEELFKKRTRVICFLLMSRAGKC